MFALNVACPPHPIALARKLARRRGLAVLHASESAAAFGRYSFVTCDPDGDATALDPLEGAAGLRRAPPLLAAFPRFIGVVPYEARRELERPSWSPPDNRPEPAMKLARWLDYPAVARVDHAEGRVLAAGQSKAAVVDLARALEAPLAGAEDIAPGSRLRGVVGQRLELDVADDEPAELHLTRVARAIELIHAGDLYQVNIARPISLRFSEAPRTADFVELFRRLGAGAPSPFGALLVTPQGIVVSSSPELCLEARPDALLGGFSRLSTEPIKGTRPRGADAEADRLLALELDADPKERAELAMIVDVERNDLHRVSVPGSVRLLGGPRVVTHRTVHHRKVLLSGQARARVSRREVLSAMLPSGSVTGAPKVRAMEVIRTLESVRRGLYTGAIGYQSHDGGVVLSMAIRTAVFDVGSKTGDYLVGGGIVADSSPERELAETRWKAEQLRWLGSSEAENGANVG